jgi:hypothetical protein
VWDCDKKGIEKLNKIIVVLILICGSIGKIELLMEREGKW